MRHGGWTDADLPDLAGTTAVVTGANSGIGLAATRQLAAAGAHVVMACRSTDRAEAARADVADDDPAGSLTVMELDLASLDSVAAFAAALTDDVEALDLLVNNAGVMAVPSRETEDGFEYQLGVNHLGHFALTGHLLDALRAAAAPRVVTVSSGMHERGRIDFEDLQLADDYGRWRAYARSKLANLLFAFELQRRADGAGLALVSVGVHPGYAATGLQRRAARSACSLPERLLMPLATRVFGQSAARGAWPTLYAATHPAIEGGEYVGPGGLLTMRGPPTVQSPAPAARDEADAERLWRVSRELTGVEYDL